MQKRLVLRDQAQDYRAGVIASIVANCNIGADNEPFKPSDFFASLRGLEGETEGQGDDLDALMAFHASLGGEVIVQEQDGTVVKMETVEPPIMQKRKRINPD